MGGGTSSGPQAIDGTSWAIRAYNRDGYSSGSTTCHGKKELNDTNAPDESGKEAKYGDAGDGGEASGGMSASMADCNRRRSCRASLGTPWR